MDTTGSAYLGLTTRLAQMRAARAVDLSQLRMAPPRVIPGRKASGDTTTIMVRCHPSEYGALTGRHADCIRKWHEAYQKLNPEIKGENNE